MKDYAQIRSEILNEAHKELVGPLFGDEEIIDENPLSVYSSGILYPAEPETEILSDDDSPVRTPDTGEDLESVSSAEDDEIPLDSAATLNSFYPSAFGVSFMVEGPEEELEVKAQYGKYKKLEIHEIEEKCDNLPETILNNDDFSKSFAYSNNVIKPINLENSKEALTNIIKILNSSDEKLKSFASVFYRIKDRIGAGRKRMGIENLKHKINRNTSGIIKLDDNVNLFVKSRLLGKKVLYTISMINSSEGSKYENSIFQVKLFVESTTSGKPVFVEYSDSTRYDNMEELSLTMLYLDKKSFAVGHGCTAGWETDSKGGRAFKIFSSAMPVVEVPSVSFNIKDINEDVKKILLMKNLSDDSGFNDQEKTKRLLDFCTLYKSWIDENHKRESQLPGIFKPVAEKHLSECEKVFDRIKHGVSLLVKNKNLIKAFKLANQTMRDQRIRYEYQKTRKNFSDTLPEAEKYYQEKAHSEPEWRPFQLAFLLLSLGSVEDNNSPDRNIVDLIWFPTGGGKTEAYLGLCALNIFYRRLSYLQNYGGTAIIMRYTLRLLTSQQFQRACTLICACERIRRQQGLGEQPVTIGLWIGGDSTPNAISGSSGAEEKLKALMTGYSDSNPFQVLSCPWCGTHMDKADALGYRIRTKPKRLELFCPNKNCDFNDFLPIIIVDEDIYNNPPTLLFGTVDKFASLASKGESRNIFFSTSGKIRNRKPDLIIQDELHLISGPLGSMVGLFECAVDILSSDKNSVPKIVGSTATIRNSIEQCRNLYNREVKQFPPPGLSSDDSFFSYTDYSTPGRIYVGVMPWGKTQSIAEIRLAAKLLQTVFCIKSSEEVIDKYWTLVAYFNSIRELGKFDTFINDDVQEQINNLSKRRTYVKQRFVNNKQELTSRKKAEEIPAILSELEKKYTAEKNHCVDLVSATNMISVGVDIDRLNLMTIVGQPKTTSEYIQASSRIGRKYPGIVFTIFNPVKSRDRSHYEHFIQYHNTLYKSVEPTSVTPFASPSRDRGLPAVFITLVRQVLGLTKDDSAQDFIKLDRADIENITAIILDRIQNIDAREYEIAKEELKSIVYKWESFVSSAPEEKVSFTNKTKKHLITSDQNDKSARFFVPNSLRNVDAECRIRQKEAEPDVLVVEEQKYAEKK
ncbi:MAG: helicase [Candidatus Melainabacteria bacterium]|nr:helicase [Candidatus Melainabacteria bacterium]